MCIGYCSLKTFFIWVKTYQGRIRCDLESSEVFHIIDSIKIQLGPNWQPSTKKNGGGKAAV